MALEGSCSTGRPWNEQVAEVVRTPEALGRLVPGVCGPRAAILAGPAQHLHVAVDDSHVAKPSSPTGSPPPWLPPFAPQEEEEEVQGMGCHSPTGGGAGAPPPWWWWWRGKGGPTNAQ